MFVFGIDQTLSLSIAVLSGFTEILSDPVGRLTVWYYKPRDLFDISNFAIAKSDQVAQDGEFIFNGKRRVQS